VKTSSAPKTNKFSIVTPSFNQAQFIERTLQSVMDQQGDFSVEHIVIDGGSTDGTPGILEKYAPGIKYFSGPDRGMADALNKGIALASGDVVGWINTDDVYLPGTFAKVSGYFNLHPECQWLFGNCRIIDEEDREVRKWITAYKNGLLRNFRYDRLLLENFISQPAVFMRRSALERVGPVDISLPTAMDYDLWLRFARIGEPGYIDDYLSCFRMHRDSISYKGYRAQFEEQYSIHKRHDERKWLLFLNRLHVIRSVAIYWMIRKFRIAGSK
jgi:glycosyltransferase involved in cell wall biosynthesis